MTVKARHITIEGDVAFVPLTRGYTAVIDAADVHLVAGHNWHAIVAKNAVYARRWENVGVRRRRAVILHRVILGVSDQTIEVDHIDRDGLNNRRVNLRKCSKAENGHNSRKQINNKSGFKGVYWDTRNKGWRAQITVYGERKHLGLFATAEEAHTAYSAAAHKFHGSFARVA